MSINLCDSNLPSPAYHHPKQTAIAASGAGFFITSVALMVILTATSVPIGVTGYSLLTTASLASLVVFVIGYRRITQQREATFKVFLREKLDQIERCSQKTEDPNSPLVKLRSELEPIHEAAEKLITCLVTTYASQENRPPDEIQEIKAGLAQIKSLVNNILADHKQLLRFAINSSVIPVIDFRTLSTYLNDKNSNLLEDLPKLITPSSGLDPDLVPIQTILNEIFQEWKTKDFSNDKKASSLIQEMRDKHRKFADTTTQGASEEKLLELEGDYYLSILNFFDHLFMNSNFSSEQIQTWNTKFVCEFLVVIKSVFFNTTLPWILRYIIPKAYSPGSPIYRWVHHKLVKPIVFGATSNLGRNAAVYPLVGVVLNYLPMEESYKAEVVTIIKTLLPPLANPVYYGLWDEKHPLNTQIAQFVTSADFRHPRLVENEDGRLLWKPYSTEDTYSNCLKEMADYLNSLCQKFSALSSARKN